MLTTGDHNARCSTIGYKLVMLVNSDTYRSRKLRACSDNESGISGCILSLPTLNRAAWGQPNYNTIRH